MKPFPYGNRKHGKNSVLRHSPAAPMHASKGKARERSSLLGAGGLEHCCQPGLAQHPASASVPHSVKAEKEEKEWRPGKKN